MSKRVIVSITQQDFIHWANIGIRLARLALAITMLGQHWANVVPKLACVCGGLDFT